MTIIGESAGAGSILHHITAPSNYNTSSLFTQTIAQSPAFQPIVNSQETETFKTTLEYASLLANTTITTLAQLKALPFDVLYKINVLQVATSPYGTFTFGPVIDGSYVPDLPGRRFLNGSYDHKIKAIAAHNQYEGTFFTSVSNQNDTTFTALVQSLIPDASPATISYVANTLYPPVFDGSYPWTTQLQRAQQITEEFTIVCNSYYLAEAFKPSKAWKYQFSVPPALHGDDIAYTFFNGDETSQDIGGGTVNATIAGVLQDYIVNFAESGKPSGKGVPAFPDYGKGIGRVLDLNITGLGTVMPDANDNVRCRFWQEAPWM